MPDTFRIRRSVPEDVEAVLDLVEAYCLADGHHFDEDVARPPVEELTRFDRFGVLWVAERETAVVGYLVITWGYGIEAGGLEAVADELYVEPKGEGIGTRLMEHAAADCASRGVRRIFLETELANESARRLYRRLGYEADDSIWMEKWLV
jgi:ribosomal protein S18 acetylase RimI-like enzyme